MMIQVSLALAWAKCNSLRKFYIAVQLVRGLDEMYENRKQEDGLD